MEKILRIKDVKDFKCSEDGWSNQEGFIVTTDKQEILFGIDNDQACCESWGYLASEDSFDDFIGANILAITKTDKALKTTDLKLEQKLNEDKWSDSWSATLDGGEAVFVNVETDKGVLQFVAYNSHNGYYGHSVYLKSKQLSFKDCV